MSKLYDYYGMKINSLCMAVMDSDEQEVDRLLADEGFEEINEGVSPLYFLNYKGSENLDDTTRDKILRIFRKILNNERFTNVNTVFYEVDNSSTLLGHLLYRDDPVFETCCVELIKSPKYQLIDYPGDDLNTAIIHEKKLAAEAIMDHKKFTKIDFSFGGSKFVNDCKKLYASKYAYKYALKDPLVRQSLQLVMDEYVLREGNEYYDATDTNIAERLTEAINILTSSCIPKCYPFPPMAAACSILRKNNDMILEILNHPKFTGEMLSRHIEDIARELTDKEAYNTFHQNKKIEGWTPEFYGKLAYFLINHRKIGLLKALLENENVCLSEQFYSFYNYFLKNAIKASSKTKYVLDCSGYDEYSGNEICRIIDEKYKKQIAGQQLDISKLIELSTEDYYILKNGLNSFYDLVSKNDNEPSDQDEIDENLKKILCYDGPFFNMFDRDRLWKFFSEYQSFDEFRQMISPGVKKAL